MSLHIYHQIYSAVRIPKCGSIEHSEIAEEVQVGQTDLPELILGTGLFQ